eukprot:COSAG01_NODE_17429_length_1152_cov_1.312441_1_plen_38_part_01
MMTFAEMLSLLGMCTYATVTAHCTTVLGTFFNHDWHFF